MNVADQFVETLAAAGVKRIYAVVGDTLNGIADAIRRQGKIEWVHVRNEEAGAFAAGAEAHLTGELAVCAGSCGPGNLHLINGLFDCHRSRVPVLGIAAHLPSGEIGSGYFQETHPQNLFQECSHYCELISGVNQMPRVLEVAIREAVGRRGVSVVVIPGDVALREAADAPPPKAGGLLPPRPVVTPDKNDLDKLAKLLNDDGRITLLCGAGCAGAHDELIATAERLRAPTVHAMRGKEHVEWDNPYDVGMTGLIGFSSGYYAMLDCDVLLMLGTDFPYRQFYPTGSGVKIAQVDLRPENIGRRAAVDLGVVGDVKATLASLLPLLKAERSNTHLTQARAHYAKARKGLDELAAEVLRQRRHSPTAGHEGDQRSRIRRRRLHRRRRPADRMGGALSGHEREAAAHRVLHPWVDGECNGAGDWRASGISWPSGDFAFRRRWIYHADGRFSEPRPTWPAGEGLRL